MLPESGESDLVFRIHKSTGRACGGIFTDTPEEKHAAETRWYCEGIPELACDYGVCLVFSDHFSEHLCFCGGAGIPLRLCPQRHGISVYDDPVHPSSS